MGFLVSPVGELMKFNISNLFYSIIGMCIVLNGLLFYIFKLMTEEGSKSKAVEVEMK